MVLQRKERGEEKQSGLSHFNKIVFLFPFKMAHFLVTSPLLIPTCSKHITKE